MPFWSRFRRARSTAPPRPSDTPDAPSVPPSDAPPAAAAPAAAAASAAWAPASAPRPSAPPAAASRARPSADRASTATPPPRAADGSSAAPERAELALLRRVGTARAPSVDEAVAALRALHASPDEGIAMQILTRAARDRALPDALAVAVASALVDRGDAAAALPIVAQASSSPALLLAADLRADAGDYGVALALAERVLLRDLDHPGARERHRRFRTALGLDPDPRADGARGGTVTVVAREPDAPFVLLREVARGGAGAVYEAEDRDLGRRVALKVYHRPDRDRAQLLHEARVAAALAGRGVVRVLDVDPDRGWIALQWAPLGALRDHVRARDRATLAPLERWAVPLASALARVHAAGWVHDDVKPANVLLLAADRPVLADFGIARRAGDPGVPGSLGYVSPERLAGAPSDPRDDVFGFGRLLEDVLDALADADLDARWRPLAAACVGDRSARPADARALLTRIRVEAAA